MGQQKPPRKSCDLCYHKRIKCDRQKPSCSHCVTYGSPCTFEAASRKWRPKAPQPGESTGTARPDTARLEERLNQALERIEQLEKQPPQVEAALGDLSLSLSADAQEEEPAGSTDMSPLKLALDLPPQWEVLAAVNKYLTSLNIILPLFHPAKLLRMIDTWYSTPHQRNHVTWAAINTVLALAHRQSPSDDGSSTGSPTYYFNNAQSVLNEVIVGDADLINVQILVGMVVLLQTAQNLKPAAVLISVALRVAHEVGLHARSRPGVFDEQTTLERDRVFWIAYILDRDISMRTRSPPVQHQDHIDIELPSAEPEDGAGLLFSADGSSAFNFFLARVQLAHIEGKVYELACPTRAQALDTGRREEEMTQLHHILDNWASAVPPSFQAAAVAHSPDKGLNRSFNVLYATHLSCRLLVCQSHVMDTGWLENLQDFGKSVAWNGVFSPAPLPKGWQRLVAESRDFLKLFMSVEPMDAACVWMTACTFVSGLVCVIANNMCYPLHESSQEDEALASQSMLFLEEIVRQNPCDALQQTRDACKELIWYAEASVCQAVM